MLNSIRSVHSLLLLCVLMFAVSTQLFAQIDTGRILGTAYDPSGAVVPNAKVSLVNEGTGLQLVQTTDTGGSYMFTALKVGMYRVEVEACGFSKFIRGRLILMYRRLTAML